MVTRVGAVLRILLYWLGEMKTLNAVAGFKKGSIEAQNQSAARRD